MTRRWIARCLLGVAAAALWPHSGPPYTPPGTDAWRADPRGLPDPVTSSPGEVAEYFATAPADLALRYPGVVGNLDGAPISVRYAANDIAAGLPGRQLLAYDPRGDGRIAEVVGDLEGAERIAVIVPGVDTTVGNFHSGLGGVQRRSPIWQARQLYEAAGDDRLAVIAWLGYDAPEGDGPTSARSDRAEDGAAALERFTAGLLVQRPQATVALIGHSYGSLVLAHAADALPAAVTDLVVLGSPGLDVDGAGELATDARLWAGLAADDRIALVPDVRVLGFGHGEDPADEGFGGLVLDTSGNSGHDGYFVAGGAALAAMAEVVVGGGAGRWGH